MQGQSADARMEGQIRRSQSDGQAKKRMPQRGNINLRKEMHDDGEGTRGVHQNTEEDANKQESCRMCDAIQAVSGMAGVPGEQVSRLNAALLSMVYGVEDAMNSAGVAESGILEAMETLSQVGLSQASSESYYPEDEDNCRADPELASRRGGGCR